MFKNTAIRKNVYFDSVTLMSLTSKVLDMEGVHEAVISMATEMNKELLKSVGLNSPESEGASAGDLILAVSCESEKVLEEALLVIDELLSPKSRKQGKGEVKLPGSIHEAVEVMEDANMAIISVPGAYAAREAREALNRGLHVMIFSDNISIEEERALKVLGREKGLLVMGPDCGTASINGTGLCFANDVRKGNIGIVAASGTGLQEVMVQIHHLGGGISHGIGTGGRDLREEIGGIMMLEGIKVLDEDEQTDVIVLVSKPPAKKIAEKIFDTVRDMKKPVVICFLDGEMQETGLEHVHFVKGLYEAAEAAVAVEKGEKEMKRKLLEGFDPLPYRMKLKNSQKKLRGLYCGGTLCAETLSILRDRLDEVRSNVAKKEHEKLKAGEIQKGHILLDLGEDEYTNGKPHPMIEPSLRNEHIVNAAKDDEVGVILLDFELGYGSHDEAPSVALKAIDRARKSAAEKGREIIFVAYVLGTELDKQDYKLQRRLLKEEGVLVFDSNREAALAASMIIE